MNLAVRSQNVLRELGCSVRRTEMPITVAYWIVNGYQSRSSLPIRVFAFVATLGIQNLRKSDRGGKRFWLWIGDESDGVIRSDIDLVLPKDFDRSLIPKA